MIIKKFGIPIELYQNVEYNKIRRNNLILIAQIIESYIENLNIEKIKDLSQVFNYEYIFNSIIKLEKSIYEKIKNKKNKYKYMWDGNFIFLYTSYSAKITKNIDTKHDNNVDTYLIDLILSGNINIDKIIDLNSYKLSPNKTKDLIKKIKEQISIKDQEIYKKTSSLYKCRSCGDKKVILSEFQGRSLDEASTLSITCTICNNNWII